jgi:hypothetical protein
VEDASYYRGVLHELIDMGMDLARQIHAQAAAPSVARQLISEMSSPDSGTGLSR